MDVETDNHSKKASIVHCSVAARRVRVWALTKPGQIVLRELIDTSETRPETWATQLN